MIGWVEIADADTYLSDKLGADAWASLSYTIKTQALMSAYRKLVADNRFSFPTTPEQNQKDAQIEYAWTLYVGSGSPSDQNMVSNNVASFSIGTFSKSYTGNNTRLSTRSSGFGYGAIVDDLLRGYFVGPAVFGFITRTEISSVSSLNRGPEGSDASD